jgi:hypothetical protein
MPIWKNTFVVGKITEKYSVFLQHELKDKNINQKQSIQ